jgi:regulator of PEP synthase PpsR (kinase-PPPase family)
MTASSIPDQQQKTGRDVFFVSDRTGLTAESYGKSLLAQFPNMTFDTRKFSFIDNLEQAQILVGEIENLQRRSNQHIIVFSTLVEKESQQLIEATGACVIDLFNTFIEPLEDELDEESAHTLGTSHNIFASHEYQTRLDAIDFAITHDDGVQPERYDKADVILVGVSRCGKTPTCLFLAMNFSIKACNYPLTDEDPYREILPDCLQAWKSKLVGLTIRPEVLNAIREKRRPTNNYASLTVCRKEVKGAENIFRAAGIPVFDTTNTSIEEISGSIIKNLRFQKT